jgi:hypothetical protein
MTRGERALPEKGVAEQKPLFICLGGPKAHDSSVERNKRKHNALSMRALRNGSSYSSQ